MCVCAPVHREQKRMFFILQYHILLISLRQGLSLNPGFTLSWLGWKPARPSDHQPGPAIILYLHHSVLGYMREWKHGMHIYLVLGTKPRALSAKHIFYHRAFQPCVCMHTHTCVHTYTRVHTYPFRCAYSSAHVWKSEVR